MPFDVAFSVTFVIGSVVWSVCDIGNESDVGAMKAFAWAAVVGRLRDSILRDCEKGCDAGKLFGVTWRIKVNERYQGDLGEQGDGEFVEACLLG